MHGERPEVSVTGHPFAVAAERIIAILAEAVRVRGCARLAISGGRTSLPLFQLLSDGPLRERVQWNRIEFFWADERGVPPEHPDSNFGMARRALISPLGLADERIHRIRGELPPEEAAVLYDAELRRLTPQGFDLILLGVGADGHIASLFPDSSALQERRALAAAVTAPGGQARITITPVVLELARSMIVLVCGAEKAEAVAHALDPRGIDLPAHLAVGSRSVWVLDQAAASRLTSGET